MVTHPFDDFAKLVWGRRAENLPVPELNPDTITPQELENILKRYAFVQMLNPEASGEYAEIKFLRSRSGWLILNYGNAMSASPGEQLFDHGTYVAKDDGSLQRICTGTGTTTIQIINTAADMVVTAKEQEHWPAIHIVDGQELMKWGIWKACQDLQIPLTGFTPSKEDVAKYQRILEHCPKTLVIQPEPTIAKP